MDAQQLHDQIAAVLTRYRDELVPIPPPPAEMLVRDTENLQIALDVAPANSVVRLEDGGTFTGNFRLSHDAITLLTNTAIVRTPNSGPALTISGDDVTVQGLRSEPELNAPTNDVVVILGARTRLLNSVIWGNGQTKRGIAANGIDTLIDHCDVMQIGRVGQESQAVATWDGTGLTIRDSFLEAGSTSFLAGGATPTIPNHVPSDLLFERVTFSHPMAWRGKGFANKTGFELKSGRRVIVKDCVIENVWLEGQTGYAITLTPSQYGNSPMNVVEDVAFDRCTIRNCGGGLNMVGFSQHQATNPTLQAHGIRFFNSTFTINRALYGGHGSLMQLGIEPADLVWDNCSIIQDGDAFLRTTDIRPIAGLVFTNNRVNRCGTYGIWQPTGGATRGVNFLTRFPNGQMTGNTFVGAHATFKVSFPSNTWVTA